MNGQTGLGLYRKNASTISFGIYSSPFLSLFGWNNVGSTISSGVYSSSSSAGLGSNDDLVGIIQGSAATNALNLTNTSLFTYV